MERLELGAAEARSAEPSQFHIARRTMATSLTAGRHGGYSPANLSAGRLHGGAVPVRTPLPEVRRPSEAVPIWLAVLLATPCEARRDGENHTVRWNWVSGRALYTNAGRDAEHIEPLGVSVMGGHTVSVCWMPGETEYTVEVYRQAELCA